MRRPTGQPTATKAWFRLSPIQMCIRDRITSTIHGQIKDQQGLALPDAAVIITSQALGISHTIKSDASGSFVVAGLPAASYEIEVSKAGFATKKVRLCLLYTSRCV